MIPANFDQLYPGRFLKAGHFPEPRTLTISDVRHEELVGESGPQTKVVIAFRDEKLSLVACKTNGICIRDILGPLVPQWVGRRITFFAGQHAGEPCVRVYGSPELERDKETIISLPRKKPFVMLLRATGDRRRESAPALQSPEPPAPKPQRSELARNYLQSMADAKTMADISAIEEALTEDNRVSSDETAFLAKQLLRRSEQLKEA